MNGYQTFAFNRIASALIAVLLLMLAACSQSTAPANAPPAAPPQANNERPPQAPTQEKEQEQAAETSEWDNIVEAANAEGKLVLSGPPSEVWRSVLTSFSEEYPDIQIEYTGANSRDFWPRINQEQGINLYTWDLRVGGPDPQVYTAVKNGFLDPVRPLLMLPEVTDDSAWLEGFDGIFADKDKEYVVGFLAYTRADAFVNVDALGGAIPESTEDLIKPEYKGKIALQDPRGGSGLGASTMLLHAYGEEWMTKLLTEQDVVVTGDNRQQAEWLVRGRYPVSIGTTQDLLIDFEAQGLKFNVKPILGGPAALSTGFGGIQLLHNAPNPNAAQVYMNWLLTPEVQQKIADATDTNSRRLDVQPGGDADSVIDPNNMERYVYHQHEDFVETRIKAQEVATALIKD